MLNTYVMITNSSSSRLTTTLVLVGCAGAQIYFQSSGSEVHLLSVSQIKVIMLMRKLAAIIRLRKIMDIESK